MKRRDILKKAGISASALAIATQPVAGDESGPARTITLDTSGFAGLNEAKVTLFEDARVKVDVAGTRPANPAESAGFSVQVGNHRSAAGRWAPEQAEAGIETVPSHEIEDSSGSTSDGAVSDSGSAGGSDIGTLDHGGGDSESDYEGGCWVRSEDPIDLNLAITEGWTQWTTSGGEVDWVGWKYHAVPCETAAGTTWHLEDADHSYTSFSGDDAFTRFYADYYNWDWSYNDNKTTAHHRLYLTSNPDGTMDWSTTHWHDGEDAGLLRTDAGWFSNYDEHSSHC